MGDRGSDRQTDRETTYMEVCAHAMNTFRAIRQTPYMQLGNEYTSEVQNRDRRAEFRSEETTVNLFNC